MLLVPAGEFIMGSDADPSASPQFKTTLPAYYVDQTEVTNDRFLAFVTQTGYQPRGDWRRYFDRGTFNAAFQDADRGQHPVVNVTWDDAAQYCQWAGKRLPTEAEWEKAARGTDGRRWPWGNDAHPEYANWDTHDETGPDPDTMRVGKFPNGASPYGQLDMVGNAREWTASARRSYPLDPTVDDGAGASDRVTRGGSWVSLASEVEVTDRLVEPPGTTTKELGFRCAVSADRAVGR
jgi:serine/threonine-protein kinase